MKYALILTVIALSFAGGWQVRAIQAQRDVAQLQNDYTEQRAATQQQARQREQVLQQEIETIQHDTQHQLAEITAFERTAADHRVRELTARYAAGSNRSHSPVTDRCPAERARTNVLAELLTELDQLAQQFAVTADRNRISGLACEKAYKTLQSR